MEPQAKKVSLFKQKMQAKKVEEKETKVNNPVIQENSHAVHHIIADQVAQTYSGSLNEGQNISSFPETLKLSTEEIASSVQAAEDLAEQLKQAKYASKVDMKTMLGVTPEEYESISKENDELLKNMKEDEIVKLQKELMSVLDPSVISSFKKTPVNLHPAAINEVRPDAYGQTMDQFITKNEEEIAKVFEMEVRTPKDAIRQACFSKEGIFLPEETLKNKNHDDSGQVEQEDKILNSFDLGTLNRLLESSNRQFNSIAVESLEKIITCMERQITTGNKGDFLFTVRGINVFRLDLIYYLESELALAFTLTRCITIPHATLNMTALSCLRAYLDFLIKQELLYYKQFLSKTHSDAQKDKFKAFTQIFIDENLLRHISYLLNNLFLGDRSVVLLGLVIEILDYLIFIDYDFFSKRIQDYGFVEQIKAFGGKEMEQKLEFLRFELGRLDIVYENIPLTPSTFRLIREAKYKLGSINPENFQREIDQLCANFQAINTEDISSKESLLREIRDILMFSEKTAQIKKLKINSSIFSLNKSVLENTILLILELHNPEDQQPPITILPEKSTLSPLLFESAQYKDSFAQTYTQLDIQYLIEGVISQESKGIPHSLKGVIERLIPIDIQILFRYHYQLKEKKTSKLSNHLQILAPFLKLLISLYSELSYQMKYILLLKTRKALHPRAVFNECFSDVLRVIIIELVELLSLNALNPDESTAVFDPKNIQWQTALSTLLLLREVKQKEALVSVLNIIKQLGLKSQQMTVFGALANFLYNISAKNNSERKPQRLAELQAFFQHVDKYVTYLEPGSNYPYHPELLFIRVCKLFDDTEAAFTQLDEDKLDQLLMVLSQRVDIQKFSMLISKNSDIPQKIVTNFNFNSYGSKPFTKVVFFLLQKPFDLKMKKNILMETVLNYAFLFSENCKDAVYGKESNYLKGNNKNEDNKLKLRFECEEIKKFLDSNDIDTQSRSSFFNRFLQSYIGAITC